MYYQRLQQTTLCCSNKTEAIFCAFRSFYCKQTLDWVIYIIRTKIKIIPIM